VRSFESLWVDPPHDNHPNLEGHARIGELLAAALASHRPGVE
jgi:hypothetical protein